MKTVLLRAALAALTMALWPTVTQTAARSSLSLLATPDEVVAPHQQSDKKRPRSSEPLSDERSSSANEDEKKEKAGDAQRPPLRETGSLDSDDEEEQELKRGIKKHRTREPQRWPAVAATSSSSSLLEEEKKIKAQETHDVSSPALDILIKRRRALLPNAISAINAWWESHGSATLTPEKTKEETEKQLAELTHDMQKLDAQAKAFTARNPSQDNKNAVAKLVVSPEEIKQLHQAIMAYFPRAPLAQQYKKAQEAIITQGKQSLDKGLFSSSGTAVPEEEKKKIVESVLESVTTQLKKLVAESRYGDLAVLPERVSPIVSTEHSRALLFKYAQDAVPAAERQAALPEDAQRHTESFSTTWLTYLFGLKSNGIILLENSAELFFSPDCSTFIKMSGTVLHKYEVYIYDPELDRVVNVFTFTEEEACSVALNANGSAISQRYANGKVIVYKRSKNKEYTTLQVTKADPTLVVPFDYYPEISADGNRLLLYEAEGYLFTVYEYAHGAYKKIFTSAYRHHPQHATMSNDGLTICSRDTPDGDDTVPFGYVLKYDGASYVSVFNNRDDFLVDSVAEGVVTMNDSGSLIFCNDLAQNNKLTIYSLAESGYTFSKTKYKKLEEFHSAGTRMEKSLDGSTFFTASETTSDLYKRGTDNRFHRVALPDGFIAKALSPDGSIVMIQKVNGSYGHFLFFGKGFKNYKQFDRISITEEDVMYIGNNPTLFFSVPSTQDFVPPVENVDDDESPLANYYTAAVSATMYKQLSPEQIRLLYDIYTAYTTRITPQAINLNEEQSALWRDLPLAMPKMLASNHPSLIVRVLPSPHEVVILNDLQSLLTTGQQDTLDLLLKNSSDDEQKKLKPLILKLKNFFTRVKAVLNPSAQPLLTKIEVLLGGINQMRDKKSISVEDFGFLNQIAGTAWQEFQEQFYKKLLAAQKELSDSYEKQEKAKQNAYSE